MKPSRRTSWLVWLIFAACVALLFWWAPPFHVISLKAARQQSASAAFNAPDFVEKLWKERLPKSAERAADASALLAAIRQDPKSARDKYGRSVGLSSTYYYYVRGEGRVLSIDRDGVSLSLSLLGDDKSPSRPDIILQTGNIFGNALRDGTGLLDVSDFADSQDFNAIASELNRRVEEMVLPALRGNAVVGSIVKFTGCAEIADESTDLHPVRLIPLSAAVR